jgi:hypothetical protein
MHRSQTWHAGSPERWKLFLYKNVQNPISHKGKILPKKIVLGTIMSSIHFPAGTGSYQKKTTADSIVAQLRVRSGPQVASVCADPASVPTSGIQRRLSSRRPEGSGIATGLRSNCSNPLESDLASGIPSLKNLDSAQRCTEPKIHVKMRSYPKN